MDAELKLLADASMQVGAAEEALEQGAFHSARDRLDAADAVLSDLRDRWPALSPGHRRVVGPTAHVVRQRIDAAAARVPRLRAVSETEPVVDPEQDSEPEAA